MALTTTANVKEYIGVTGSDDDDLIDRLVLAAQAKAESFCDRKFDQATYTEYFDGNDSPSIVLSNTPIDSITSVALRDDNDEWSAIDATSYDFNADTGEVFLLNGSTALWEAGLAVGRRPTFPKGGKSTRVIYVGGYDSIPADLEQAAIELTVRMLGSTVGGVRLLKNAGVTAASLGYQSFTFESRSAVDEWAYMTNLFGAYRRVSV